jgi:hypothetical protein
VRVAGNPLTFVFVRREAGAPRFVTERFPVPASGSRATLVLARPYAPDGGVGMQVQRWLSPGTDAVTPAALAPISHDGANGRPGKERPR